MKVTKESQIRKGMSIFIVHNHNGFKGIKESKVLSKPYEKKYWGDLKSLKIDLIDDSIYLEDFGVGANYNENRLFTTKREAKNHLKKEGRYTNDFLYDH